MPAEMKNCWVYDAALKRQRCAKNPFRRSASFSGSTTSLKSGKLLSEVNPKVFPVCHAMRCPLSVEFKNVAAWGAYAWNPTGLNLTGLLEPVFRLACRLTVVAQSRLSGLLQQLWHYSCSWVYALVPEPLQSSPNLLRAPVPAR